MIHVVTLQQVYVLADGTITASKSQLTIAQLKNFDLQHRIAFDVDSPNSANWPTLKEYLQAEDTGGYKLVHLDQYTVITQG